MYDIYLASPFFNDLQVEKMEFYYKELTSLGFNVFKPMSVDEIVSMPINEENLRKNELREEIFSLDRGAIDNSKLVFAICDESDSGTLWEVGYAVGQNIPVVVFSSEQNLNLMITQSATAIYDSNQHFASVKANIKNLDDLISNGLKIWQRDSQ